LFHPVRPHCELTNNKSIGTNLKMMQSEQFSNQPTQTPSPVVAVGDMQQQTTSPNEIKKKLVIVEHASKRITAIEDDVIKSYNILQDHKHPKLFVRISAIMSLLSIVCFCIWILTTPRGYPWFIHIVWLSILSIAALLIFGSPRYSDKIFSFHAVFFVSTSFKLIVMNEHTPSSFPWSIYPIAVLLLAITIHGMIAQFRQYLHHFYIHLVLFTVINFVVFVTYCYTIHDFPWFLIVLGGWGVILLAHLVIWKAITFKLKPNDSSNATNEAPIQPPTQAPVQIQQPQFVSQTPVQQPQFVNRPQFIPPPQQQAMPPMMRSEAGFQGDIDPSFVPDEHFDEDQFFGDDEEFTAGGKKKGMYEQV